MLIYTQTALEQALSHLSGWEIRDGAIEKIFVFKDFKQALGFIVQAGLFAEQADHHPEIHNVYNKVVIRLNTHSAKAVTSKDTDLAAQLDQIR